MQHYEHAGNLEVDHFDPRKKKDLIQDYSNLFPASRHCNGKKGNTWPTKAEFAAGCRFLNPCNEVDYGEQIWEDPKTHKLIGSTVAARWHIRICDLNADCFVRERQRRYELWRLLEQKPIKQIREGLEVLSVISALRNEAEKMIPKITPPPGSNIY